MQQQVWSSVRVKRINQGFEFECSDSNIGLTILRRADFPLWVCYGSECGVVELLLSTVPSHNAISSEFTFPNIVESQMRLLVFNLWCCETNGHGLMVSFCHVKDFAHMQGHMKRVGSLDDAPNRLISIEI